MVRMTCGLPATSEQHAGQRVDRATGRTRAGRTVRETRRYRTCVPKRG